MSDFFEVDFLDVEAKKSGDAITIRYKTNGVTHIHVVDGGYQDTGQKVVDRINQYYDTPKLIDHVVATHPDGDHTGGLRTVLEEFEIEALWMLRPWLYAEELIPRFTRFSNVENLKTRLKEIYPNIAALEEIAAANGIPIYEPFQGETIGAFTVMTPTKARYLDLVVESEKTPESVKEEEERKLVALGEAAMKAAGKFISILRAAWGEEIFSAEETSAENEMSIVQYAKLCDRSILLTADTGRAGLCEAADYADTIGLSIPGIDRFQVPHHGSRRNVSTECLDRWLGQRLEGPGTETFQSIVSAAKEDKDHPRKAVVRACIHRGSKVFTTQGTNLHVHQNAPDRGWGSATPLDYPEDQET